MLCQQLEMKGLVVHVVICVSFTFGYTKIILMFQG
jgi:hypothetical protein